MQKLTEVLAMGGYAAYVWPSYIIAAFVMICMAAVSIRSLGQASGTLTKLQSSSRHEA